LDQWEAANADKIEPASPEASVSAENDLEVLTQIVTGHGQQDDVKVNAAFKVLSVHWRQSAPNWLASRTIGSIKIYI